VNACRDRLPHLRKTYDGKVEAVRGVNLQIRAEECFGFHYDPSRSESVVARALADESLQSAAGRKDVIETSAVASSEPGSRYIDFLIPGLLGMNLMNAMWGIGFALVDMRQPKLLKRFVATPMRRSDFLLALLSSCLVLMLIEVSMLLGFGVLAFRMRVLGSLWSMLVIGAIGAISFGGLGLLTASRAQKIESASGLMNLVMMPMWIFSGVFFSGDMGRNFFCACPALVSLDLNSPKRFAASFASLGFGISLRNLPLHEPFSHNPMYFQLPGLLYPC
jgi:hypothetical protein